MKSGKKKSQKPGKSTSKVEILNISKNGIWLYVKTKEYFLSYQDFPWFSDATVSEIFDVKLIHGFHLRWEQLDVDLELESLEHPERYPLKYIPENERKQKKSAA
ncbi:MAG: DUF2442 domain-containing protein [Candidatus Omnitrophica bacterium]|nr:DUF2442 domain-containing protein [Candidatus Omnitrophota bacterium]